MTAPAWISSLRKKDQSRVRKYVSFLTHATRMYVDPYLAHVVRYAPSMRVPTLDALYLGYDSSSHFAYSSPQPDRSTLGYCLSLINAIVMPGHTGDPSDDYEDTATNLASSLRRTVL